MNFILFFKRLCLLSEGRVAYIGPSKEAISFFKCYFKSNAKNEKNTS